LLLNDFFFFFDADKHDWALDEDDDEDEDADEDEDEDEDADEDDDEDEDADEDEDTDEFPNRFRWFMMVCSSVFENSGIAFPLMYRLILSWDLTIDLEMFSFLLIRCNVELIMLGLTLPTPGIIDLPIS
jgi:hypothetical protein